MNNNASPDDWAKIRKKPTTSKFGVRQDEDGIRDRTYRGVTYHSRLERDYAEHLDLRVKARQVSSWARQIGVKLLGQDGSLICRWYADFLVSYPNGEREYHEPKGRETDVWIIKKKLYHATTSAQTGLPLIVVTRSKSGKWVMTQSRPSRMA